MAAVYAATARDGGRVAIKLLHGYWAQDAEVRRRFLREGYAANRVKHPAVISALDDGVTDCGLPFLVLELLDGESLEAVLAREGRLTPVRVLVIADQVLEGLTAAHAIGVLHRDLKPDNFVIDRTGAVRIMDFGIAFMDDVGPDTRITVHGCAMGTPGFMAPEQARGDWDRVDERTDLWSLGATMFALLSGRDVFVGTNQQVLVATLTWPAPRIRELCPHVPPGLAAIIDRALAFMPQKRFASTREMHAAVRKELAHLRPTRECPTLSPVARAGRATRPNEWQPTVVAACGAIAIALVAATQPFSPPAVRAQVIKAAAPAWESAPAQSCKTASGQREPSPGSYRPLADACRPRDRDRATSPPR
ncbi:MAG TPA: protein kinase [Nitrospiraceae bacterium]|nr:protein kinase [Nitrospiraceae bacterium]